MGKYQLMPPLSDKEYDDLKQDIAQHGVTVPVEYDQDGEIIDGFHRAKICEELGITDFPKQTRTYADETERRSRARNLNIKRRQLSNAARRKLIAEELAENPGQSARQVAEQLGVDKNTVLKVQEENPVGEIHQQETNTGKDGKQYRARKPMRTKGNGIGGVAIALPEGAGSLTEVALRGIRFQEQGDAPDVAAKKAGLSTIIYGKVRDTVLLSQRRDLSKADSATVKQALRVMNENLRVTPTWDKVEPIARRVWGTKGRRVKGPRGDSADEMRFKQFDNAISFLQHACESAIDMVIPHISAKQATTAIAQLKEAEASLKHLGRRIKGEAPHD